MRLVTSLLALAAAGVAAAIPLPSLQDVPARVWLNTLPSNITFDCHGRIAGYYADVDSGCQMYHMCDLQSRRYSYLCPAYTEFNQFYMTCVQHDRVDCAKSKSFFHMNEMIGQPRTRFHDLRQHEHSKKKDTEGSKATNRVDTSEPAGHVLFEFETKMDVPLTKGRRSGPSSRSPTSSVSRSAAPGRARAGAATRSRRPAGRRNRPAAAATTPSPPPRRLFKTLSPPPDTTAVTEPAAPERPLKASAVTARGNTTISASHKARPRVRFSDLTGRTTTTAAPVKTRTTPRAVSSPAPISAPKGPALPRNTYRTFGQPGSFSFGTLLNGSDKVATPLPLKHTTANQGTTARSTTAPPTRSRSTKAPSTKARSSSPTSRARFTTASSAAATSRGITKATPTDNNTTTTIRPLRLKPRPRLPTTTTKAPKRVSTTKTTERSNSKATTARSSTAQVTTPRSTTSRSTTRRQTARRTTSRISPETTTAKPTTTRRSTRRPTTTTTTAKQTTTTKPTATRPIALKTRTTTNSRTRRPSTSSSTTSREPTTTRSTARKPATTRSTTRKPTTTKSTTRKPTTAKISTANSTKRQTTSNPTTQSRRPTHSSSTIKPTSSATPRRPPVPPRPATGAPKTAPRAPPVPSLLSKMPPPADELEALRLSFTLDPPRLAVEPDGPHEQRNMKVRGELITGEMALRKLVVDQLKPVYFPNPTLPLNLLPPLLSEQEAPDGKQTTTLTLPVRRERPDTLLQAAAVAFNLLPPELASLVPPLLTPPPLSSGGATGATSAAAPATSTVETPSTSTEQTTPQPTVKPRKDRPGLTMKFGKKKTRFRLGDSHGFSGDACYPCMKSFIKDLDRCHPCVIIR